MSAILAVALVTSSSPLLASDFSDLSKPSHARLHLVAAKRMQQIECAGLAMHFGHTRAGFSKELAAILAEKVTRRLSAELGDEETAKWFIKMKSNKHSTPFYDDKLKSGIIHILEPQCKRLFEQAAKGDAELEDALGPVPSKPLELPNPEYCLATITYATERGALNLPADTEAIMRQVWTDEAPDAEKATRQAKLQTALSMIRSIAPDNDQLSDMFAACVPTIQATLLATK